MRCCRLEVVCAFTMQCILHSVYRNSTKLALPSRNIQSIPRSMLHMTMSSVTLSSPACSTHKRTSLSWTATRQFTRTFSICSGTHPVQLPAPQLFNKHVLAYVCINFTASGGIHRLPDTLKTQPCDPHNRYRLGFHEHM